MLRRMLKLLGLDRAIGFSVASQIATVILAPITAVLIIKNLTSAEQGFYYTFAGIVSIQIFFELGAGNCISQFVAHEFAYLRFIDNEIEGEEAHKERLASIWRSSVRMYIAIAALSFISLVFVGHLVLGGEQSDGIKWQVPWFLMCVGSALSMLFEAPLSVLQGANQVAWVSRTRFINAVARPTILIAILCSGGRLFGPSVSVLAVGLITSICVLYKWRFFFLSLYAFGKGKVTVSWKQEIFPYQWRIAVSWIAGYLTFSLFNPVIFKFQGPEAAGRFGFTWSILQSISALSNSWIQARTPAMGSFASLSNWGALNALWRATAIRASIVCASGCFAFGILSSLIEHYYPIYSQRMLPVTDLMWLALAVIVNNFTFSLATYVRSRKVEKYMYFSLLTGLAAMSNTLYNSAYGTVSQVCRGYFFIVLGTSLYAIYIYRKNKIC